MFVCDVVARRVLFIRLFVLPVCLFACLIVSYCVVLSRCALPCLAGRAASCLTLPCIALLCVVLACPVVSCYVAFAC